MEDDSNLKFGLAGVFERHKFVFERAALQIDQAKNDGAPYQPTSSTSAGRRMENEEIVAALSIVYFDKLGRTLQFASATHELADVGTVLGCKWRHGHGQQNLEEEDVARAVAAVQQVGESKSVLRHVPNLNAAMDRGLKFYHKVAGCNISHQVTNDDRFFGNQGNKRLRNWKRNMAAIIPWVMLKGSLGRCKRDDTLMGLIWTDSAKFYAFVCPMVLTFVKLMDSEDPPNLHMNDILHIKIGNAVDTMAKTCRNKGVWSDSFLRRMAADRLASRDDCAVASGGCHWTIARVLAMMCSREMESSHVLPKRAMKIFLEEEERNVLEENFDDDLVYIL
jgi:hypothetical protein